MLQQSIKNQVAEINHKNVEKYDEKWAAGTIPWTGIIISKSAEFVERLGFDNVTKTYNVCNAEEKLHEMWLVFVSRLLKSWSADYVEEIIFDQIEFSPRPGEYKSRDLHDIDEYLESFMINCFTDHLRDSVDDFISICYAIGSDVFSVTKLEFSQENA